MKKYIYLISLIVIYTITSCKKLDREFITDLTLDQAKVSYENLNLLANGVYANLPDGMLYIGGNAMMASASDEAEFTLESNTIQTFNIGSWNAKSNPDDVWANYFSGIYRANLFLANSNSVNLDIFRAADMTVYNSKVADIKRWKYEARFLRAYYYFELIKRYGGVPIFKQAVTINDVSSVKRNTLDECVQFVSDECDSAATVLAANTATLSTNQGRATKVAALALKSRLLLYAASDLWNDPAGVPLNALSAADRNLRWKAAADAALAAINEQTANGGGLTLATNGSSLGMSTGYKALFNGFNLTEIIFAKRNATANTFEKINYPIGFDQTTGGNTPSQDMVDAYDVRQGTGATATAGPFDWNNATHVANIYNFSTTSTVGRDPRLGFSVAVNGSSFQGNGLTRNIEVFPGGRDAPTAINGTKTGYYLRKYVQENLNLTTGGLSSHTWIIFRIPELFLNYVEALNEYSSGNPDIKKYYDYIRNRTGVSMPLLPAGLSQDQVRIKIRNERRVEFAFEDQRIWDVRRWKIAESVLNAPLRGVDVSGTSTAPIYAQKTVENRVFTPNMYFYPLPQNEIVNSPGLTQNPGW